jgi:hypothetical protein
VAKSGVLSESEISQPKRAANRSQPIRSGDKTGVIGGRRLPSLTLNVERLRTHMPYGLIVLVASIALTGVYVFVSGASYRSKVLVVALLLVSFAWRYGLFLQVALGIFLSLHFTLLRSRSKRD